MRVCQSANNQLSQQSAALQNALKGAQSEIAKLKADNANLNVCSYLHEIELTRQKRIQEQETALLELGNSLSTAAMKIHVIEDKEKQKSAEPAVSVFCCRR